MKIIFPGLALVLAFVLNSCSEDDDPVTYQDLTGKWTFSHDNVLVDFTVGRDVDGFYIINTGRFRIDGVTYQVEFNSYLQDGAAGPNTISIVLVSNNGNSFAFTYSEYSSDYKEISSLGYFYVINGEEFNHNEPVVMKR